MKVTTGALLSSEKTVAKKFAFVVVISGEDESLVSRLLDEYCVGIFDDARREGEISGYEIFAADVTA